MVRRAAAALVRAASRVSVPYATNVSYYSKHNLMHYDSLHVYNCLVIMEFILRVGFVGPQRCWSGRFRRCLSLVLRCYDISLGIQ